LPTSPEKASDTTPARQVLEAQPEGARREEILRELAFDRRVQKGLKQARAGINAPRAGAPERIRSWQR
jgi:hypothetical protein